MRYILTREVTTKECNWLKKDFKKGEVVFKYTGSTYGCCSPNGTPFTIKKNETPFFELPNNSVEKATPI
tara:strand:- start:4285 stop:4491 length:207 start_codon:yes stop_codon:yes gene_type:complete